MDTTDSTRTKSFGFIKLLARKNMKVGLACIDLPPESIQNLHEAITEERIGQGKFIKEFEEKFAKWNGSKYAVFVSNGTVADTLALWAIKDGRNEVILPAFTFVAQANSVIHAGLKPVFVDVDERAQIDPTLIERAITPNTLAIFPAHLLGRAADMDAIRDIAMGHGIFVIEDCCEALGAEWGGKKVGSIGDIGTFSFYASHHITTGEGGMITTDSKDLYNRIISIRNHGRKSDSILDVFQFEEVGFNAKGTNLQAAIGTGLVDKIDEIVKKRRENVGILNRKLGLREFKEIDKEYASPHCYPLFEKTSTARDLKLMELEDKGIEARKLMACIPNKEQCPAYAEYEGIFPNAEKLGATGYYVPVHHLLTDEQLNYLSLCLS